MKVKESIQLASMKIIAISEIKEKESKSSDFSSNTTSIYRDQLNTLLSLWTFNPPTYLEQNNNDVKSISSIKMNWNSKHETLKEIQQKEYFHLLMIFDFLQLFTSLKTTKLDSFLSDFKKFPLISKQIIDVVDNIINGDATIVLKIFNSTIANQTHQNSEFYDQLNNFQLIFGITKNFYSQKTLNYKVYDIVQNKIIELMKSNHDKNQESNLIKEIKSMLETFVSTKIKLSELGINKTAIIEDTEKKIGRLRLFQIK